MTESSRSSKDIWDIWTPREHLAMSGGIWVGTTERGKGIAPGIYWVETRDAAKYLPMYRTGPTTKN